MVKRIILTADEGKIITNGKDYGRIIHLAEGRNADGFYEITEEEYQKIMDEKNNEYDLTEKQDRWDVNAY